MPQQVTEKLTSLPLCVDLDGSLTPTDTLWEGCLKLIRANPVYLVKMLYWLVLGKAGFKREVSRRISLDAALLPYTDSLVDYLRQQKQAGRELCLVTAANQQIAQAVAAHLGLFDKVLASDNKTNLSGKHKAQSLVAEYGEKGFVYAANAGVDLAVWRHAAGAILVNAPARLRQQVEKKAIPVEAVFSIPSNGVMRNLVRNLRPHQWAKNSLLFVPIILASSQPLSAWLNVVLAFIAFSLTASSIYIINDLFDLEADRKHPRKRRRPFASAVLPIKVGIMIVPVLLGLAALTAWQVNTTFSLLLLVYITFTTAYSISLKLHALVDVFTLAILYTLRVIAGAFAADIEISHWLLAFSVFFFLSFAFAKRYSELHNLAEAGDLAAGTRGYLVRDLPMISLFGVTSSYLSIMVMIMYIHDLQASRMYSEPMWLWSISMVLLYWVSRVWLKAYRGHLDEDPVLFALRDRISYAVAGVVAVSFWLAL